LKILIINTIRYIIHPVIQNKRFKKNMKDRKRGLLLALTTCLAAASLTPEEPLGVGAKVNDALKGLDGQPVEVRFDLIQAAQQLEAVETIYNMAMDQLGPEHDFETVGVIERIQIPSLGGVLLVDTLAPGELEAQQERGRLASLIFNEQGNPDSSAIGPFWAQNCGIRGSIQSDNEAFYVGIERDDGQQDILPVFFPYYQSIEEVRKFTDGTYKFDWERGLWMRVSGGSLQAYEIIMTQTDGGWERVDEKWIDASEFDALRNN
jgi:hypothetical protein